MPCLVGGDDGGGGGGCGGAWNVINRYWYYNC